MAPTSVAGEGREFTGSTPPETGQRRTEVPGAFLDLLRGCTRSADHLELRDVYTPRDPDYLRWLAGDHFDPAQRWPEWIRAVQEIVNAGVVVRRARVVSEPVTDYVRYEHALTDGLNIAAGEQVRWLPRRQTSDLLLPGNDFWLFDDRLVLFNHFAGDGSSGEKELRNEPEVVSLCATAFEAVWRRATPHETYLLK